MKVYHYTSPKDWGDIQRGSWKSHDNPGLGANFRVGKIDDKAWKTLAIFALLEPVPQNWIHNSKFPDTWSRLKADMGKMLLEIEVEEGDPNVFVIDRGEVEKFRTDKKKEQNRRLAEGNYIGSKVPLLDYLKNIDKYPFALPEVIITDHVPLARISISSEQPLLHESIEEWAEGSVYRQQAIREITSIAELKVWYETKYLPQKEKEQPSSELRGKLR